MPVIVILFANHCLSGRTLKLPPVLGVAAPGPVDMLAVVLDITGTLVRESGRR